MLVSRKAESQQPNLRMWMAKIQIDLSLDFPFYTNVYIILSLHLRRESGKQENKRKLFQFCIC